MPRSDAARAATVALILILAGTAHAAGDDQNTTGLPTYPHDERRKIDAVARSIPNGQHCTHYASSSKDALGTVIDWYKKALPNAKVDVGNDIVNVYRTPDMHLPYLKKEDLNRTSIEIFKCKDASRPKQD